MFNTLTPWHDAENMLLLCFVAHTSARSIPSKGYSLPSDSWVTIINISREGGFVAGRSRIRGWYCRTDSWDLSAGITASQTIHHGQKVISFAAGTGWLIPRLCKLSHDFSKLSAGLLVLQDKIKKPSIPLLKQLKCAQMRNSNYIKMMEKIYLCCLNLYDSVWQLIRSQ